MVKKGYSWIEYLLIFVILFNLIFISGCFIEDKNNDNIGDKELFIGISTDISGFYPLMTRDTISCSINQNFYNCLIEIDNKTKGLIPGLAESWNNPNNLTWRFFLRKDVKFHNGDLFNAHDIKFTIELLDNSSYYKEMMSSIDKINILDNYTIDIITKEPSPVFLYNMISVNILSKEYWNNLDDYNNSLPIGTGPYKLIKYVPNEYISLESYKDYWDGAPEIKKVTFVVKNTTEKLINGLLSGELDISPISFNDIDEVLDDDNLIIKSVQTPGVVYLGFELRANDSVGFNNSINPLSNVNVRRAMYHAINIDDFIEIKQNQSSRTPISQIITPNTFGYNPNINRLEYDIKKARQLLDEAGYLDGFTIKLDCAESNNTISLCQKIVDQLALINISVVLNPLPYQEHLTQLYLKNTSFFITGIMPLTAESACMLLLHSSNISSGMGVWNYGNYSNENVDYLCEKVLITMDIVKRKDMVQDILSTSMDEVAYIPLYSSKAFYGVRNNIYWDPRPSLYVMADEIHFKK